MTEKRIPLTHLSRAEARALSALLETPEKAIPKRTAKRLVKRRMIRVEGERHALTDYGHGLLRDCAGFFEMVKQNDENEKKLNAIRFPPDRFPNGRPWSPLDDPED